jgi:hypothetical protein
MSPEGLSLERFGFAHGDVIVEMGAGTDCDDAFRQSITRLTGSALLPEDSHEVVDYVLLWWRDGDGDLIDALVDALTYLSDDGCVWLMTPKAGRAGHVEASDIQDAVPVAGLSATSSFAAAGDWGATKVVPRRQKK